MLPVGQFLDIVSVKLMLLLCVSSREERRLVCDTGEKVCPLKYSPVDSKGARNIVLCKTAHMELILHSGAPKNELQNAASLRVVSLNGVTDAVKMWQKLIRICVQCADTQPARQADCRQASQTRGKTCVCD